MDVDRPDQADPRAHIVSDIGGATVLGVALCGYPAQALTLVRDVDWDEVDRRYRCAFCQLDLDKQAALPR
jgi:hypothetical protein